jgi:hypothetical protein
MCLRDNKFEIRWRERKMVMRRMKKVVGNI